MYYVKLTETCYSLHIIALLLILMLPLSSFVNRKCSKCKCNLTGVDYLWITVMFLSAVWTLSLTETAEDPLVSK